MGNIKLGNEIIPDRRVNGARIKLDIADWIKISITIFTTFAIIIFGAGKLLSIVNSNASLIEKSNVLVFENDRRLTKTESEITNIKENLIYIRGKIDTIVLGLK